MRGPVVWLWADFALPERGWKRWRAQLWLAVLYQFFQAATGLRTGRLPPTETILRRAGFELRVERVLEHGLLRSAVYSRSPAPPGAPPV